MQDHPTAPQLLEALAAFLRDEVAPALDGHRQFHARVAGNVVDILRREWELGPQYQELDHVGLARILGHDGDVGSLFTELAATIRSGAADERMAVILPFLRQSVRLTL